MSEYLTGLLRRPPVGWWDLLDIAIVSIILYEFLKLIRGTRAVQMAAGSLLLVGLFYISRLAPLQTVNWMIRNMLVYVAFAAIVIFQSDIRRALAHFGQAPFFRYFTRWRRWQTCCCRCRLARASSFSKRSTPQSSFEH